jgi:hypothetical protein
MKRTMEKSKSEIYALPSHLGLTEHKSSIGMTVQQVLVMRHQYSFIEIRKFLRSLVNQIRVLPTLRSVFVLETDT